MLVHQRVTEKHMGRNTQNECPTVQHTTSSRDCVFLRLDAKYNSFTCQRTTVTLDCPTTQQIPLTTNNTIYIYITSYIRYIVFSENMVPPYPMVDHHVHSFSTSHGQTWGGPYLLFNHPHGPFPACNHPNSPCSKPPKNHGKKVGHIFEYYPLVIFYSLRHWKWPSRNSGFTH